MSSANFLVTGASGALGSAFIQSLDCKELNVVAVSRQAYITGCTNFSRDVSNPKSVKDILNNFKPDYIFHFCATYVEDFTQAYLANTYSAKLILDFIKNHNLNTQVILVGSAAEYGNVPKDDNPIKESRVLKPTSIYGLTKSWQSQLVTFYAASGVNVKCARIFNLFGENIKTNLLAGFLSQQIQNVLLNKQKKIKLRPLGDIRDYISISDAIKQIKIIAQHGLPGEIYNVGSGIPTLVRDFVISELQKNNLDFSFIEEESPRDKTRDRTFSYACVEKIKTLSSCYYK
jgi:GDP-4-dehydro-6-deoxy-D-mannose reductase